MRTTASPATLHQIAAGAQRLTAQLTGRSCASAGMSAMTASLALAYHRPVTLMTPLLVTARITTARHRTIHVAGSITTAADPTTALATADGVFIAPDPQRARALFPQLTGAAGA